MTQHTAQPNYHKMFTKNKKILKSESPLQQQQASTVIKTNEDILSEILFHVPVKPICQFKCVSKQWHSLITSPHFCHQQSSKHCKKITSLLAFHRQQVVLTLTYDVFQLERKGTKSFTFVDNGLQMKIMQSCNGLLCCRTFVREMPFLGYGKFNYYICNPTTHQCRKLPYPNHGEFSIKHKVESVLGVFLAFDPRKSRYFKVLCVYISKTVSGYFEMEVYSSETGRWRRTGDPFVGKVDFGSGVYWNGAVNWLSLDSGDGLYFNVDEERLGSLPMLPYCVNLRRIMYFGESYDHLHLIEYYDNNATRFDIYEMDKEYSGWFIRYYNVDIEAAMNELLKPMPIRYCGFNIVSVVSGENDEDSFIVVDIHGKVRRYNLGPKSFEKTWEFGKNEVDRRPVFHWRDTFHYIESICTI